MPQTHDVGDFFFHLQPHPRGAPMVTVAQTYEVEEPFMLAKSIAIRLGPFRKAVVLGRWAPSTALWDEEDPEIDVRLHEALGGRPLAPEVPIDG